MMISRTVANDATASGVSATAPDPGPSPLWNGPVLTDDELKSRPLSYAKPPCLGNGVDADLQGVYKREIVTSGVNGAPSTTQVNYMNYGGTTTQYAMSVDGGAASGYGDTMSWTCVRNGLRYLVTKDISNAAETTFSFQAVKIVDQGVILAEGVDPTIPEEVAQFNGLTAMPDPKSYAWTAMEIDERSTDPMPEVTQIHIMGGR